MTADRQMEGGRELSQGWTPAEDTVLVPAVPASLGDLGQFPVIANSLSSLSSVSASVELVVGSADMMLFFSLMSGTLPHQVVWVESIQEGYLEEVR